MDGPGGHPHPQKGDIFGERHTPMRGDECGVRSFPDGILSHPKKAEGRRSFATSFPQKGKDGGSHAADCNNEWCTTCPEPFRKSQPKSGTIRPLDQISCQEE